MLTKGDLQQIGNVVSERVNKETPKIVRGTIKRELNPIKKDIVKIRKNIDDIVYLLDHEYLDLRKRVERIEEHLRLQPLI